MTMHCTLIPETSELYFLFEKQQEDSKPLTLQGLAKIAIRISSQMPFECTNNGSDSSCEPNTKLHKTEYADYKLESHEPTPSSNTFTSTGFHGMFNHPEALWLFDACLPEVS
jgi:hypothetical protein